VTADKLTSFATKAAASRQELFSESAIWNGQTIRAVCLPPSELDQMAGGYEPGGTMRALVTQTGISLHDRLTIAGKVWQVSALKTTPSNPEISLTLTRTP
jgi:hypothetical protein